MVKKIILFLNILFIVIIADNKGIYFPIKKYKPTTIPNFNKIKNQLPKPILTNNPEFIKLYYVTWELAWTHIKRPPANSPLISDFIDEAFNSNIFQWDTHFMILFWKYVYYIFPAINSHNNFYNSQDSTGYICRELQEQNGEYFMYKGIENTINPPLFPWVEYEYFKFSNDTSRFNIIYQPLKKYAEWINKHRLSNINPNLYWQTNLGSGMDNSPRFGVAWIDMSSQMALYYKYLTKIATILKKEKDANMFLQKYKQIAKNINQFMWDDSIGLYFDLDYNSQKTFIPTIASFWPLLANIPDKNKAKKLIKNLQDTTQFFRNIPFPSLSAKHPLYSSKGDYWRGGVWAPTNYITMQGLEKYKYYDFLYKSAYRYLKSIYKVFQKTNTLWENYSPDYYSPGNRAKQNFVGWTGIAPITILIEYILGIKVDAAKNTITCYIHRTDLHGIKNLHFGKNCISLIAYPNQYNNIHQIRIKTKYPFTLIINTKTYSKKYSIQKDTLIQNQY